MESLGRLWQHLPDGRKWARFRPRCPDPGLNEVIRDEGGYPTS